MATSQFVPVPKNDDDLNERFLSILTQVKNLNIRLDLLTHKSAVHQKVEQLCRAMDLSSVQFVRTPTDYYTWTLDQRKEFIGASSTHHLCKSIVVENTEWSAPGNIHSTIPSSSGCEDPLNSRFYCVIIQYTARLLSHQVFKFVRGLKNNELPLKSYHFQLAKNSETITGFEHNAVCPIGMAVPIPIIVDKKITNLHPNYIWLGGGEVDLKLGIRVSDLLKISKNVFVADVTQDAVDNENSLDNDE